VVEFGLYGRRTPKWCCKRCVAEAVTRRHRKVRRILVDEAGGRCAICGYGRCAYNLHFHHVHPADKEMEMTAASGRSLAAYRLEARKCVLVCANCHGEIEAGAIGSPPPGTRWGDRWIPVSPVATEVREARPDAGRSDPAAQLAFPIEPR
jgi:hypothetical protein